MELTYSMNGRIFSKGGHDQATPGKDNLLIKAVCQWSARFSRVGQWPLVSPRSKRKLFKESVKTKNKQPDLAPKPKIAIEEFYGQLVA